MYLSRSLHLHLIEEQAIEQFLSVLCAIGRLTGPFGTEANDMGRINEQNDDTRQHRVKQFPPTSHP